MIGFPFRPFAGPRANFIPRNVCGAAVTAAIASAMAGGCAAKTPERLPTGDRPPLSSYRRVLVHDFRDGVSNSDKSTRGTKRITMSKVVDKFADRIAEDTRAFDVFDSVVRKERASPNTIIVTGTVTVYRDGNQLSGLPLLGKAFNDSHAFEAMVKLVDGANGRVVTTFPLDIDSRPSNAPEYSGILRGPAATVAAKLYELKVGHPVPAGYYTDGATSEETAP